MIDTLILKSVPLFDEAAINTVKNMVYEPIIIDGRPKKALFTLTIIFRLSAIYKK